MAAGNGSATTSVLVCASPRAGTGPWALVCRRKLAINGPRSLPTPGLGRYARSSTGSSDLGISPSIQRWIAHSTAPVVNKGVEFSPNAKFSFDFTKKIAGGLEYYASYGSLAGFDPHYAINSNNSSLQSIWIWSNDGNSTSVLASVQRDSTDHLIVKCIIGRRFSWPHGKSAKFKH